MLGGDLAQAVGIRAVRGADDEDDVDDFRQFAGGTLTVLRRVADVLGVGADDRGKARLQGVDHRAGVVDAQRRLGDESQLVGVADRQALDLVRLGDEMDAAADAAHRALDLGVAGMADQDDFAALIGVALPLAMDLGDERAGRVDDGEAAVLGRRLDGAGDAVRAEDGDAARRDLVELVDELGALGAQTLDDVAVVHDFVADIDRRAVLLERPLDDLDGALDAGAKTSWLGQHHPHETAFHDPRRASPADRDAYYSKSPGLARGLISTHHMGVVGRQRHRKQRLNLRSFVSLTGAAGLWDGVSPCSID